MKRPCLTRILFWSALSLWAIPFATLSYWEWFDHPEVFSGHHTEILNPDHIHVGGFFQIHTAGCNLRDAIPNSGQRTIEDGYTFALPDISVVRYGCFDKVSEYIIPTDAHVGHHIYKFCAAFRINPIKIETRCIDPIGFEVLP